MQKQTGKTTRWLGVILQSSDPSGSDASEEEPKETKTLGGSGVGSQRAPDNRRLNAFLLQELQVSLSSKLSQIQEFLCPVFPIWIWIQIQGGLQTEGFRGQERAFISWGNCFVFRVVTDGE